MKTISSPLIGYLISLLFLMYGCSSEPTDKELLKKDTEALNKSLYSAKVHIYKMGKICVRASVAKDTLSPEFRKFKGRLDNIFNIVMPAKNAYPKELSIADYLSIYRDYRTMNSFIEKTDEDIFPTLTEALIIAYGDSTFHKTASLSNQDKVILQNKEHALLSALVMFTSDLGKEISLYECTKTQVGLLSRGELRSLLQLFRGFLFMEKKLLYLSEQEFNDNIEWLDKNEPIALPYVQSIFALQHYSTQEVYRFYHSLNYLFRGLDRMMMGRDTDEKRSLEDFSIFIKDTEQLHIANELTCIAQIYVYTRQEEHQKAIAALKQLRSSNLLSENDRKNIDESVVYLQKRKKGDMLNKVTDKYFMSRIASAYLYRILTAINWREFLKQHQVPYTNELFNTITVFKNMISSIEQCTSTPSLKAEGEQLQQRGKDLMDKAGELFH